MKMDLIDRATLPDVRMEIPKRLDDETTRILNAVIKAFLTVIKSAPTVDAEPVRHGRWQRGETDTLRKTKYYCSECGKWLYFRNGGRCGLWARYCPNCGAKMDAEVEG